MQLPERLQFSRDRLFTYLSFLAKSLGKPLKGTSLMAALAFLKEKDVSDLIFDKPFTLRIAYLWASQATERCLRLES